MRQYLQKHNLLNLKTLWNEHNVENFSGNFKYKSTNEYHTEIAGSSKSRHKFYRYIKELMKADSSYNGDEKWFENKFVFPKKYKMAMIQSGKNPRTFSILIFRKILRHDFSE
jgi:hypothetical protein